MSQKKNSQMHRSYILTFFNISHSQMKRNFKVYIYSAVIIAGTILLILSSYYSDFFIVKTRPHKYDYYCMNVVILLSCIIIYYYIYKWIKELQNTVAYMDESDNKIILYLNSNKTVEFLKKDIMIEKKFRCSIETNSILEVYLIVSKPGEKYLIFQKDLTIDQIEVIENIIKKVNCK